MTSTTPESTSSSTQAPDLEALGDSIAELSARIQVATYELLVLIREFDERHGWTGGFASCAHWLNWRLGLAMGAAREKVRVARALAELPVVSRAMREGRISYSKVRALTRVATPESEERLLAFAPAGTAAHVERLVGAWRRVDRVEETKAAAQQHRHRSLTPVRPGRGRAGLARLRGDVPADRLRRLPGSHAAGVGWERAGCGPEDPDDSTGDSAGPRRPRPQLPLSRVCGASVRCAPHHALGGWRCDPARQPGPAVPSASSGRARGELHSPTRCLGRCDLRPTGRADRGVGPGPSTAARRQAPLRSASSAD